MYFETGKQSETLAGLLMNFLGRSMKNYFCHTLASTLLLILMAGYAVGKNCPYHFSSKAIESVPDIVERANSPNLNDRIGIIDRLVIRDVGSDVASIEYMYKLAFDLPPQDYCNAARSVLEGGLLAFGDSQKVIGVFLKIYYVAEKFRQTALLPEVVKFLEYNDSGVQIFALRVLEQLEAKQYAKEIVKAASGSDFEVSRRALEILAKFNSKEAVPVFISCLKEDNYYKRSLAIDALGRIGDRSTVPQLVQLIKTEKNFWALKVLVRLGAQEAVPYLRERYKAGGHNGDFTLLSLAYFGDEQAISDIIAEMTDENMPRGESLLERLLKINARAVIPALISALENEKAVGGRSDRGGNIVGHMMVSLARLEANEAIPVLRRYLTPQSDSSGLNSFLAERAIEALGILKAKQVIPELLRMLDSGDYSIRARATMALARIGELSTIERVITELRKRKPNAHHVQVLNQLAYTLDPNTYEALLIRLPRLESLSLEEHLNQLTEKSKVKFSLSVNIPLPDEIKRRIVAGQSNPTGLSALNRIIIGVLNYSAHNYTIFIDNDVVRFVTIEEAYDLWDRWLNEYRKNHPDSTTRKSTENLQFP